MRLRLFLLLTALAVSGCGDTFVDPFLREGGKISITGALVAAQNNVSAPVQTLRIQAVRTDAAPLTDPDHPAVNFSSSVITVDTATGDSLRWDGRRTQFADGTYGQLFSATFRPRPGGSYEIIARRDTAVSRVRLTMPSGTDPEQRPFETRDRGVVDVFAWDITGLDQAGAVAEVPCGSRCSIEVPAPTTVRQLAGGRIAVDVDLTAAARAARSALSLGPEARPTLAAVRLTVRLLGDEWLRAGDPTFSNVENGYGFVGGAVTETLRYQPSLDAAQAAGFTL